MALALDDHGLALVRLKAWSEAEAALSESLAIRKAKEPNGWLTFNTQSMRGAALLGQGQYNEAEPLLLDGYQGLKQREGTISWTNKSRVMTEAAERLVQLYDAWDRPDEAAKWRKEREALQKQLKK